VGILNKSADSEANVIFHTAAKSIAPGQSAVFYEGDDIIGGGIIQKGRLINFN
jgi:tRNA-specific 2-thiouridylase